MLVRLLFLSLAALNLGAGAWLLFGRAPAPTQPPATDPGVAELRLLTEARRTPQAAAAASSGKPVVVSRVRDACDTLGPFTTTVDMRAVMQTLTSHVARIQYREEQVSRSHGYWVYLPATASREQALDEARQLAAKGIHDYYVVTAGDSQNTISLGLFNDRSNASKRLAKVQALGFQAKVEQRVETEPAYWVDYAVPAGSGFDWQAWLPGRSDLQSRPIDCFQSSPPATVR
ncbi:MAG TPA: SPOR domain-containing protein [Rhodanobacteraceae bacterium]|nr:SPOR domain-containing protein [Rhodanobacteraceae bacterium]